jgi:hypothetical protein
LSFARFGRVCVELTSGHRPDPHSHNILVTRNRVAMLTRATMIAKLGFRQMPATYRTEVCFRSEFALELQEMLQCTYHNHALSMLCSARQESPFLAVNL